MDLVWRCKCCLYSPVQALVAEHVTCLRVPKSVLLAYNTRRRALTTRRNAEIYRLVLHADDARRASKPFWPLIGEWRLLWRRRRRRLVLIVVRLIPVIFIFVVERDCGCLDTLSLPCWLPRRRVRPIRVRRRQRQVHDYRWRAGP